MVIKVNLRRLPHRTRRAVRELTRELRASGGGPIDQLNEKADAVLRVAFLTGGAEELAVRHTQLNRWLQDNAGWRLARLSSFIYSNQAGLACAELEGLDAEGNLSPELAAVYVSALAADGQIERALDRAKTAWPNIPASEHRDRRPGGDVFSLLLASGNRRLLAQHRPASPPLKRRLAAARTLGAPRQTNIPTFCINLDDAPQRWQRAEVLLGPGVALQRQRGVAGRTLPTTAIEMMDPPCVLTSRGEIGCLLSHVAAWERVAALGDATPFGLVAEDDAIFTYGPGVGLDAAHRAAQEGGCGYLSLSRDTAVFASRLVSSDGQIVELSKVMAASIGRTPGLGTHGYLLSPAAAQALIDMVTVIGLHSPSDWQMMAYLASADEDLPAHIRWQDCVKQIRSAIAKGTLAPPPRAGVYVHPIITPVDFGYQSINAE